MSPSQPSVAAQVPASGPRWSVVATVREPAALLVAFAAHHLDLGAAHVHLYLDAPNPELRAAIGDDPRVTLIDCDAAFYDSLGRRVPTWINRRQIINANHAETQTSSDWLFHLDADEFLNVDPASELVTLAPEVLGFWVPNGERVFLAAEPVRMIFDGALALPMTNSHRLDKVRGPDVSKLTRYGLLAHDLGKGALRVGRGIHAGIHRPRVDLDLTHWAQSVNVSHFDGMTRLHWALKLQRHARNGVQAKPGRSLSQYRDRQIALAAESGDDLAPIFALHDRLRLLPPRAARKMTRTGRLISTGVDAEGSVGRIFPHLSPDLSVQSFDRALMAEHAMPEPARAMQQA